MIWFFFSPIDSYPHSIVDPNNYILIGTNPPTCAIPTLYICAIRTFSNGGRPIITQVLIQEMTIALNSSMNTTNVRLRPTLY